jgi:hypothetical protein
MELTIGGVNSVDPCHHRCDVIAEVRGFRRMADILLAHCNHLHFDRKQTRKMQPYPPLQTILAAACLRSEGYDVALFDSTLEYSDDAFRAALDRHRPRMVALCEDNFNFLTKMCLTRNRELAFFMTQAARERGLPVVVNSSDASDHISDYLCHGVDFVIVGEVERTLVEVTRHLLDDEADCLRASLAWLFATRRPQGFRSMRRAS